MNNNQMYREYWANKEQRATMAINHTRLMDINFTHQIETCIKSSLIYDKSSKFQDISLEKYTGKIETLDMTTSDAAYYASNTEYNITILNFASFKNPGGKFLNGSMAQEESLCHKSFLYNVLRNFDSTFYEYNRKHTNYSMYSNRAIYSPSIMFFDENYGIMSFNVITCAAPNIGSGSKYYNVTDKENHDILLSRCKFVLDIAHQNLTNILILGAFGCGVFKQNPYNVANTFKYLLMNNGYKFKKVIFAIPNNGHSKENYNAFNIVFSN